jgi:TctA family transporter
MIYLILNYFYMEHLEALIPILALFVGATSSLLISVMKLAVKKYSCKELEESAARWVTLMVCALTTFGVMVYLFEATIPAFATLFLAIYGSSQLLYTYTNSDKFITQTDGAL